jgi:acylphosphatase
MIRTVNILISGRVQGVGFRWFTKNKAQDFGVTGTVKNRDDGRVEIVAQANTDILEPFIEWCHEGPITARVDKVELIELTANESEFGSFEII